MDSDLENEEPLVAEHGKRRVHDDELLQSTKSTKRQRTNSANNRTDILSDINGLEDNEDIPSLPIYAVQYRRVLRNIPQDIPYVPVTTENGSRVYLRILQKKKKPGAEEDEDEPIRLISGGSNRKLYSDWETIKKNARHLKEKFHEGLAAIVDGENVIARLGVERDNNSVEIDSLWVDKYKPRSYMDLLSDEGTNKSLLHWLKLWDKSVFGNDYLSKVKITKEKFSKLEAKEKDIAEKKFHYKSFKPQQPLVIDEGYDEMGRPKFKVALLYGPPGLGKTTAAHIIIKHSGYTLREMNASDDRSVEIFRKILDDTTQSRSEAFQGGKPNCLVIDEIDGAPVATVNILIELMTGNATEKGKSKIKKVLKRPIICICNDFFAPSLKELKKHAYIIQFLPISVQNLTERLQEISLREHLHLDNGTIQSLCEKSECDIRSCLSTLQFLKKKRCSPKDALFSQIGMKDKSKGIFAVWHDIFMIPDGKKKYFEVEDLSKPSSRFKNVLRVAQSYGEYEQLLDGVFENYLRAKYKDCYFESILENLSWTNWFHDMQESVDKNQNWVLMGYLPIYFVMCHFLCGQRSWFSINFPKNNMRFKIQQCRDVVSSVLADITPSAGRFMDPHSAVVDLFPSLTTIIQPSTIRPVPTQIWSARERETLRNIVEIMTVYNLQYTQIKNIETGAYIFIMEPDITTIAKFKGGESQGSKRIFPYAVKQLIAREIETEKMRRNDSTPENSQSQTTTATEGKTNKPAASPSQEFKVPKLVPKRIKHDPTALTAKDFFGRAVAPSAQSTQDFLAQERRSLGIYFRFKQGYSNAVRRFIKMKDLL